MGWFGVFEKTKEETFKELFSQKQYIKEFKLLWEKHLSGKSIAIYMLDGRYVGETILWSSKNGELMYKPISWTDSIAYIPKKWIEKLLLNATELEVECYNSFREKKRLKDSIKSGTIVKLNSSVKLDNDCEEDTFKYFSHGCVWAVNLKMFVSGITKEYIASKGFEIVS